VQSGEDVITQRDLEVRQIGASRGSGYTEEMEPRCRQPFAHKIDAPILWQTYAATVPGSVSADLKFAPVIAIPCIAQLTMPSSRNRPICRSAVARGSAE